MRLKEFLNSSYTAFHAVKNGCELLKQNGFEEIDIFGRLKLSVGGKYFFTVNNTTLIAFKIGKEAKFNVVESHTDSPALKIKGRKTVPSPDGNRLNVEKYGGLILHSFENAPLKIAGRLFEKTEHGILEKLVASPFFVNVPSLAIHHNPEVNDKLSVSVQKDMLPLVGSAEDIYSVLSDNEVIDADLYVVPATEAFDSGVNGEYICSPRIDNLTSVYASLNALIQSNGNGISIACCFDNEEVGSRTKQGAGSKLLATTLKAIIRATGGTEEDFLSACKNGFILSVDNAHAVHPAHPEKNDPYEKVVMNGGIVVKHHPNYATDGESSAILKVLLEKSGVPYQDYYNNSDVRCGGTIGLITSSDLCMKACDIGVAQLAMHAGVETVGSKDVEIMQKGLLAFFNASFSVSKNEISIK